MKILVLSAHPDDETLGCGGTLLKHRDTGDEVYWLIATRTHEPIWPQEIIDQKAKEVQVVSEAYGMKEVFKLDYLSGKLETVPLIEVIIKLKEIVQKVRPDIVYSVFGGDIHSDHQVLARVCTMVFKPSFMREIGVKRYLCFETMSSTEAAMPHKSEPFIPQVFNDISPYLNRKIEIMNHYQTEIQPNPQPRGPEALEALAKFRGASIGVPYAESFMLLREIST